MYGDEIIRAIESSGQKCGARGAPEVAGHIMRGILEYSISAGVVSDNEKNAFLSMNHLAILMGCLLTTPGQSRHLVSIYEASQKPCFKYKIEMSSIDGIIPILHKAVEQRNEVIQYFSRGSIVLGNLVFNALCHDCYRTTKLCFPKHFVTPS